MKNIFEKLSQGTSQPAGQQPKSQKNEAKQQVRPRDMTKERGLNDETAIRRIEEKSAPREATLKQEEPEIERGRCF